MTDDLRDEGRTPWRRICVEGVAIVISILLAFAIDAWWEGLLERREERQILVGLRDEFLGYQADLEQRASNSDAVREGLIDLLAAAGPTGEGLDGVAADRALLRFLYAGTWDPGRRTLDAVISSGRLELIRDQDLRGRLASWGAVVDEVRDGELLMRTFVTQTVVPFLASKGVPFDRAYETSSVGWPTEIPFVDRSWMGYEGLWRDREFVSLVHFKLAWERVSAREYQDALSGAVEIIDLIGQGQRVR